AVPRAIATPSPRRPRFARARCRRPTRPDRARPAGTPLAIAWRAGCRAFAPRSLKYPGVAGVSAIVVSHNSRPHLRRCLDSLASQVAETIVVDAASTDGSVDDLRAVGVVRLDANRGYGAALNAGAARASGDLLLLLNADTWTLPGAGDELARALADAPRAGVAGPKLVNEDGPTQQSVRGFPTPWRLATEYFFLRWFAPRSRALNAFYAAGFDHSAPRTVEWLVGAA